MPAGRYGRRRCLVLAALWLGVAALWLARWLLVGALWVIRTVGPRAFVWAEDTEERVAELDLVMDEPPYADDLGDDSGVVNGEVLAVRWERVA